MGAILTTETSPGSPSPSKYTGGPNLPQEMCNQALRGVKAGLFQIGQADELGGYWDVLRVVTYLQFMVGFFQLFWDGYPY